MAVASFGRSERHLPRLVVSQFETGVERIDRLMRALQIGDSKYKRHIEKAFAAFSEAENDLEKHIHHQTRKCRKQEAELSSMQERHKEMIKSLASVEVSLESLSSRLKKQKEEVESAQKEVDRVEEHVQKAKSDLEAVNEMNNKVKYVTDTMRWVPIAGHVLGKATELIFQQPVDAAEGFLHLAESELSSAEDTLSELTEESETTENSIERRKRKQVRLEEEMEDTEDDIYLYRKHITKQHRVQTALRKVMTRLGKVSGRAEVLRDTSSIMNDIAVIGIPLKSLFDSLEEFITQPDLWKRVLASPVFQAICDDDDDEDDEW